MVWSLTYVEHFEIEEVGHKLPALLDLRTASVITHTHTPTMPHSQQQRVPTCALKPVVSTLISSS